ncbi:MAG: enoyl-CoA hydratase [Candidatus Caldarchaeum sp.]|nr:enoyl-CoA hydratase [Candidatus Caldarchaeum sp.]MCX8200653.1 enoyl-CoA hydratase [Candidatus Caldarchaeum sp.]MDW8435845.1 enoyl-CoA hydratase [Candidatus Caldarchaeum sp.]
MNTSFNKLVYTKENGIAAIVLNNPSKYNALELDMRKELKTALEDAAKDPAVRVVVLKGAGGNFSAGADIRAFLEWTPEDALRTWNELGTSMVLSAIIRNMRKPVVAVVEGYCLGGGFELALSCDLVVAAEDAVFGLPEVNLGLIPGGGGTQRVSRIVGEKKAKQLVMLGERFSAAAAEKMGLVNMVVPKEKLDETVKNLVDNLLSKPPVALAAAKEAVNAALETGLSAGLRTELNLFASLFATEDQKEGARAFLEKRKPVWKGR